MNVNLNDIEDLGPALKEMRKAKGWSCQRLAKEIGASHAYVSLVETGHRTPHTPKLIDILDALGYDLVAVKRR